MLKQEDPNTGLSEFLIRKLANNYKIRSFKTGNKILIDYDSLMAFLQSQDYDHSKISSRYYRLWLDNKRTKNRKLKKNDIYAR